ncbi:MAG: serine/threonine protein kinase [Vulcanimicrobiota bacterium]
MLDSGDVINDRYTVVKTIGGGAFGTVYLVSDDSKHGDWFAIKEMVEVEIPAGERQEAAELFAREAEILKSLSHPGLPGIFDSFTIEDSHYIVMEYIYGLTLEEKMQSSQRLYTWEEVLPWAEELCEILLYLHTRMPYQVIFRDLKPSNIIITPNDNVKLIDFGIARLYSPRKVKDTYFMGTPGFSPPEQYGRGQSDGRSDIFALGATLYRLLTKADMEKYAMKFPPLSKLSPAVPEWLEKVIMKCLAVNPGERYQSVLPLLGDLHMRRFTEGQECLNPATILLPAALVRIVSKVSPSLLSSQPAVGIGSTVMIIAVIMSIIFSVIYCLLFGFSMFSFIGEYCLQVKCIVLCCIAASFLYWSYKRGVHRVIVPALHSFVVQLFYAHPWLKTISAVIHVFLVLAMLSCIVYNIIEGNDEWQDFTDLRSSVIIVFVLFSLIHWISRPGTWRIVTIAGMICFLLSGILVPNFLRARAQGCLSPCKSHLKNIGTAMEMYSSDNQGRYPRNLAAITPNYLKTLPTCPEAGRMSYRYVSTTMPDIYTVWCHGANHTDRTGINMPEYDSIEGLREK